MKSYKRQLVSNLECSYSVMADLALLEDLAKHALHREHIFKDHADLFIHNVLINHLKMYVGIRDEAMNWFISYLSNRSFSVCLEIPPLLVLLYCFWVPQGSILGPLLFTIYMLPLGQIMCSYDIEFHCYADDTQLYVPVKSGTIDTSHIMSCLIDIKNWMSKNVLQLNDSKSEVLIITPCGPSSASINNLSSSLGALSNSVRKEARNFDDQVTKVVQSCFAQLRQLTKIKLFLSFADLEKVIHAFISSRLDYCNALYSGISKRNLQRFQLIQNAAPRLLTHTKKSDHITPILAALHWLPVSFRIDFVACF